MEHGDLAFVSVESAQSPARLLEVAKKQLRESYQDGWRLHSQSFWSDRLNRHHAVFTLVK
jgi:hypothetical protein